jgi:Chaperone of endosialidase
MKTKNITTSHLRNPINLCFSRRGLFLILLVHICFALMPGAQAVSPAPDGGYAGGNTAEGQNALFSLTNGTYNTALGFFSLRSDSTGAFNTAIGAGTLLLNNADNNTATGAAALLSNTTGSFNTANGAFALLSNSTGSYNTAYGFQALYYNTAGLENTTVGAFALYNNTGIGNMALGNGAGFQLTTGNFNIDIGNAGVAGEGATIRIGDNDQTALYLAGIAGQTVGVGGTTCYVDNDGKPGVLLSARRFKTDIADMGAASDALLALRPVTFHYKPELDKTGIPQFGLVAEEVAAVNPDLVTHDTKGELSTVRYEAVNAMLLNEFLKEHRTVQEQTGKIREQEASITHLKTTVAQQQNDFQATVAQQQKGMEAVTARLDDQAAQIQKVSSQLEESKPAPQTVLNNH